MGRQTVFGGLVSSLVALLVLAGLISCGGAGGAGGDRPAAGTPPASAAAPAEPVTYRVVGRYAHDPMAFTQGLVWHDGGFYESTGLLGRSTVRRVAFPSGKSTQSRPLPASDFGEGLALVGDRLVQLTWQNRRGYVYDRATLTLTGQFAYATEGWGLAYDGTHLVMSDGTPTLTFLDAATYRPVRTVTATLDGAPVDRLNELEVIDGQIWANVWQTDRIVRIDPISGRVTSFLDLAGLLPPGQVTDPGAMLNGIAYDEASGRVFVTGKLWPTLFALRVNDLD